MNWSKEELAGRLKENTSLGIEKSSMTALNVNPTIKHRAVIIIQYPGAIISENHYLGRNGVHTYVKSEARDWQNELIYRINAYRIDWKGPLKVHVSGVFKNNREVCDLHNLKILFDSIQIATGVNDRYFQTETEIPVIDKTQKPHFKIEIQEI